MNSRKEIERIMFYSKEDKATSHNLIKAEKFLNNFRSQQKFSLNDLLEFYNIKLHFDNDLFLPKWSKAEKDKYSQIIEEKWEILKNRLLKIDDQNIEKTVNDLEYNYKNNF